MHLEHAVRRHVKGICTISRHRQYCTPYCDQICHVNEPVAARGAAHRCHLTSGLPRHWSRASRHHHLAGTSGLTCPQRGLRGCSRHCCSTAGNARQSAENPSPSTLPLNADGKYQAPIFNIESFLQDQCRAQLSACRCSWTRSWQDAMHVSKPPVLLTMDDAQHF